MAMANAKCKCKTCGKDFAYRKECYNRTDANNFEEWAADHIDECPECRRARIARKRDERAASLIEKYGLPEITGVSEKQITYANDLRKKWLAKEDSESDIERLLRIRTKMEAPEFGEKLKKLADDKYDGDTDKALAALFTKYSISIADAVLRESNASKLLDVLTRIAL